MRLFCLLAGLAAGTAARAESPAELLARVDKAAAAFKDLSFATKMTIHEPGGSKREVAFTTVIKGDKRLTRFTAPPDVKGMGLLAEGRDTMYAVLPAFGNRVRRLGRHAMGQSFMGSDVSYEDLAPAGYGADWEAKSAIEDEGAWVLSLALKPGRKAALTRLKLWVDKKLVAPVKVEAYDEAGQKARTHTLSAYETDGGLARPRLETFVDHRRGDHTTELRHTEVKVDSGVPDGALTKAALKP